MQVKEAKDVLVGEIEREASLEGISLSGLERRMLYFTESGECPEDPIQLNYDFETAHDTDEYEKKITELAKSAYRRLKKDDPGGKKRWDDAVHELNKGDHYILLIVPQHGEEKLPPSVWKTMGLSLLLVLILLAVVVTLEHYDFHIVDHSKNRNGISAPGTYAQVPVWVQRSLLAVLVAGYIYAVASGAINRFFATSSRKIVGMFRRS
jgi:hypothetical protein